MTAAPAGRPFRYEWDGTLRRLKLPAPVKLVAAYVSQYADNEGRNTRPGVERLALETGHGTATVKRALKRLRDLGLLELVRSGSSQGRRGKANEYRLAIPDDLLERVDLVDGFGSASTNGAAEHGSPGDPRSGDVERSEPVDNDRNTDHHVIPDQGGGESTTGHEHGSPDDPGSAGTGITGDRNRDHLVIPHQPETTPASFTTPEDHSLPPVPLTPREGEPVENPENESDVANGSSPTKCEHGLTGGRRPDGLPNCAICRRRERTAGGTVIPFPARVEAA